MWAALRSRCVIYVCCPACSPEYAVVCVVWRRRGCCEAGVLVSTLVGAVAMAGSAAGRAAVWLSRACLDGPSVPCATLLSA